MADTTVTGMPTERFGIKEVANVKFYAYGKNGVVEADPCLYLDTLKVSNIEFTSEQTEARGGRGNAPLIIWDYGREATVTLQDALLSIETLNLLFAEKVASTGPVVISANTFPATYKVVGETLARNESGVDEIFTWTIEKAKVQSNVTLTMEAEGDPTVIDITLRVLRGEDGKMMTLTKGATA